MRFYCCRTLKRGILGKGLARICARDAALGYDCLGLRGVGKYVWSFRGLSIILGIGFAGAFGAMALGRMLCSCLCRWSGSFPRSGTSFSSSTSCSLGPFMLSRSRFRTLWSAPRSFSRCSTLCRSSSPMFSLFVCCFISSSCPSCATGFGWRRASRTLVCGACSFGGCFGMFSCMIRMCWLAVLSCRFNWAWMGCLRARSSLDSLLPARNATCARSRDRVSRLNANNNGSIVFRNCHQGDGLIRRPKCDCSRSA